MCTDRSCYEGSCEGCRKIDALVDWPYRYQQVYKKRIVRTAEQEDNFNKFMILQIRKAEEMGHNFYFNQEEK